MSTRCLKKAHHKESMKAADIKRYNNENLNTTHNGKYMSSGWLPTQIPNHRVHYSKYSCPFVDQVALIYLPWLTSDPIRMRILRACLFIQIHK